jgi:2-keto-3-deoxy-L-rhamnonate aldolase RhmA
MKTPENTFKSSHLARGEQQIGLWLALADSYPAELCAGCRLRLAADRWRTCAQ